MARKEGQYTSEPEPVTKPSEANGAPTDHNGQVHCRQRNLLCAQVLAMGVHSNELNLTGKVNTRGRYGQTEKEVQCQSASTHRHKWRS